MQDNSRRGLKWYTLQATENMCWIISTGDWPSETEYCVVENSGKNSILEDTEIKYWDYYKYLDMQVTKWLMQYGGSCQSSKFCYMVD